MEIGSLRVYVIQLKLIKTVVYYNIVLNVYCSYNSNFLQTELLQIYQYCTPNKRKLNRRDSFKTPVNNNLVLNTLKQVRKFRPLG